MKRIITIAILAACSTAAFAETTQTPSEFTQELRSINSSSSFNGSWDAGFISGVAFSDPKVCVDNGMTTIGTVADQLADAIDATSKDPSFSKHLTVLEEKALINVGMRALYPCK